MKLYVKKVLVDYLISGVKLTANIESQAIKTFCSKNKLETDKLLNSYLEENALTRQDFINQILLPYKLNIISKDKFKSHLKSYFLEHKENLDEYIYTLLRVKSSDLAYELYLQIESDEKDFSSLARLYSEGAEKYSSGLVGPSTLVNTHPILKKHIISAEPGKIIEPKFVDQWWIIIRLEKYIPAKFDISTQNKLAMQFLDELIESKTKSLIKDISTKTEPV